MSQVYFGFSKKVLNTQRNEFLELNREKFLSLLNSISLYNFKFPKETRFLEYNNINIRYYHDKIGKSRANTLREKEVKEIIYFLNNLLKIDKEVDAIGDSLVDYMYQLSNKCYELYKDELDYSIRNSKVEKDVQCETFEKPKEKTDSGYRYQRNALLPPKVISLANYTCEVDREHKYFISAKTNNNYVEVHHLIPLGYQKEYTNSLDVIENMIPLCVICHKKIHHALFEEKKETLINLYYRKKDVLKNAGISVELADFLKYYQKEVNEDW
ncbi:HNH endonuclease [Psychrobacillus sp. FSL K6-2684]|uniref:HNH endonuclease n=1 Tax=Psychrobacillus sp. FSL K6-2684 TaxID=2921547 RepID=UPI0030FA7A2C